MLGGCCAWDNRQARAQHLLISSSHLNTQEAPQSQERQLNICGESATCGCWKKLQCVCERETKTDKSMVIKISMLNQEKLQQ